MELYNKYKSKYLIMKKQLAGKIDAKNEPIHKVIIIGGGCAGLTAALYAARANLKPVLFAGNLEDKGGLLSKTSVVENYPGVDGILGYDLIRNMEDQAVKNGTTIIDKDVVNVDFSTKPVKVIDSDNEIHLTESLIVAPGSTPNKLGLPKEDKLWGRGISSCAVCDGALYKSKKIVVIGGGDTALEEATYLTKFSDVTLIHRRDAFRASKVMQQKLFSNPKIKIIYDTIVTDLHGDNKLTSITCKNIKTNETFNLEVDGLFYGLGLTPNSQLFKGQLELDEGGYIVKDKTSKYETATSVEGVFVAGDVADKVYRQAVVAAGDGCKAALDVNDYLEHLK